jgi:hypothetical protein
VWREKESVDTALDDVVVVVGVCNSKGLVVFDRSSVERSNERDGIVTGVTCLAACQGARKE